MKLLSFKDMFKIRLSKMLQGLRKISIILILSTNFSTKFSDSYTFGPFNVQMPNMSEADTYKFAVYALLEKRNFTLLSAEYITHIGFTTLDLVKTKFRNTNYEL